MLLFLFFHRPVTRRSNAKQREGPTFADLAEHLREGPTFADFITVKLRLYLNILTGALLAGEHFYGLGHGTGQNDFSGVDEIDFIGVVNGV